MSSNSTSCQMNGNGLCSMCNKNNVGVAGTTCIECDSKIEARAKELNDQKMIAGYWQVLTSISLFIENNIVSRIKQEDIQFSQSKFNQLIQTIHPFLVCIRRRYIYISHKFKLNITILYI